MAAFGTTGGNDARAAVELEPAGLAPARMNNDERPQGAGATPSTAAADEAGATGDASRPGTPEDVSLSGVLGETVAAARAETITGLKAVDLFHSNRIVLPSIITPAWNTEFVFRGHVREMLERVAHGEDTRPGTAAECCIAMAEVNKAIPLHGASAGFYLRMWRRAFPDHPIDSESLIDHYEAVHRQGMDQHEHYVRRKLAIAGRRLDPERIECDGEHWGRPVLCRYQGRQSQSR